MQRTNEDSSAKGETPEAADELVRGAARLSGGDRRLLGRIAEFLGFADLVAVLMVVATVCSAIATWRTATIATALYQASERPYMGVVSVTLSHDRPSDPRVRVEYKNFGSVAAEGAVLFRRMTIDGKIVAGQTRRKVAGIVSPGVPHRIFVHLSEAAYDAIVSGRSTLRLEVGATYQGLYHGNLCYLERFVYEPDEDVFEVDGGSPRCEQLLELRATADAVPAAGD
jgi:hypothetical protein